MKVKLYLFIVLSVGLVTKSQAQKWQHETTVQAQKSGGGTETSTFKLWIPSGTAVAKAFVIISDRSAECKKFSEDTLLRKSAVTNGYGIIYCTGATTYAVSFNTGLHHDDTLQAALVQLAALSNHPEVEFAPLISFGHSLGINFSTGMGYWNHERMAGVISFKLGSLPTPSWATQTQTDSFATIPHLAVSGELEGPDFNNGGTSYLATLLRTSVINRRTNGELIHQIVERNGSHTSLPDWLIQYMVRFIEKAIDYRIPMGANPALGPVTLNRITESTGVLGRSAVYNSFKAANYSVLTYQAGTPASDFWFFDQELADYWQKWHTAEILFTLATAPPYCTGDTVTVNYSSISGITFGQDNVFKMLLSNVHSAFNYYTYALRSVGVLQSSATSGSFKIIIPDNIHEYSTAVSTNIQSRTDQNRYRLKIVSSSPYYEGENNGNDFSITPCQSFSLMAAPLKKIDVFPVSVFQEKKDTTFPVFIARTGDVSFNAGNVISVQLSDKEGSFSSPTIIGSKSTQITTTSGTIGSKTYYRDDVSVTIPDTLPPGHHYRMRIVSSDPQVIGSSTGEFYSVASPLLTNMEDSEQTSFVINKPDVYPNPASGVVYIAVPSKASVKAQLLNSAGIVIKNFDITGVAALDVAGLPSGIYFVKVSMPDAVVVKRLVKE